MTPPTLNSIKVLTHLLAMLVQVVLVVLVRVILVLVVLVLNLCCSLSRLELLSVVT